MQSMESRPALDRTISNTSSSNALPRRKSSQSLVVEFYQPDPSPPPSEVISTTNLVSSDADNNASVDLEANRLQEIESKWGPRRVKLPEKMRSFVAIEDYEEVVRRQRRSDWWVKLYGVFCVAALLFMVAFFTATRLLPTEFCHLHHRGWLCSWRYTDIQGRMIV